MKADWTDPDRGPTPEQLAAFADGELADADRAAIEAWLQQDAEAAAEVESLRAFTRLWRDAEPPSPNPAAWSTVRNGIEARLNTPAVGAASRAARDVPARDVPARLGSPGLLRRLSLGAIAASLLALMIAGKSYLPVPPPDDEELFAVVASEDVVILSINGSDTDYLVVARPPVDMLFDHDLATNNDVVWLNSNEPRDPDRAPADMLFQDGAPPMIVAPPGWERAP